MSLFYHHLLNGADTPSPFDGIEVQLREHDRGSGSADITFSNNSVNLAIDSTFSALYEGYCYVCIPKSAINVDDYMDLTGRITIVSGAGTPSWLFRLYDGFYDRTSVLDWPNGSPIPTKGNGIIEQYVKLTGDGVTTERIIFDAAVLSSISEPFCTVAGIASDPNTSCAIRGLFSGLKIFDSHNVLKKDFAIESRTIHMEGSTPSGAYGALI